MVLRKSRKRRSRSPCRYGRKKSMRRGCKSRPGPKRRSIRRSRKKSLRKNIRRSRKRSVRKRSRKNVRRSRKNVRRSKKRSVRRRRSLCKYGRKKSARRGCKSRPGPKRRSVRRSKRRKPRRNRYNYQMITQQSERIDAIQQNALESLISGNDDILVLANARQDAKLNEHSIKSIRVWAIILGFMRFALGGSGNDGELFKMIISNLFIGPGLGLWNMISPAVWYDRFIGALTFSSLGAGFEIMSDIFDTINNFINNGVRNARATLNEFVDTLRELFYSIRDTSHHMLMTINGIIFMIPVLLQLAWNDSSMIDYYWTSMLEVSSNISNAIAALFDSAEDAIESLPEEMRGFASHISENVQRIKDNIRSGFRDAYGRFTTRETYINLLKTLFIDGGIFIFEWICDKLKLTGNVIKMEIFLMGKLKLDEHNHLKLRLTTSVLNNLPQQLSDSTELISNMFITNCQKEIPPREIPCGQFNCLNCLGNVSQKVSSIFGSIKDPDEMGCVIAFN